MSFFRKTFKFKFFPDYIICLLKYNFLKNPDYKFLSLNNVTTLTD